MNKERGEDMKKLGAGRSVGCRMVGPWGRGVVGTGILTELVGRRGEQSERELQTGCSGR